MIRSAGSYAALLLAMLPACSGGDHPKGPATTSQDELNTPADFAGATLKAGTENPLSIEIDVRDGTESYDRSSRNMRARATREGAFPVDMDCYFDRGVTLAYVAVGRGISDEPSGYQRIDCVAHSNNAHGATVKLSLERVGDTITGDLLYAGNNELRGEWVTFVGADRMSAAEAKISLSFASNPDDVNKNPFAMLDRIASAMRAAVGTKSRREYRGPGGMDVVVEDIDSVRGKLGSGLVLELTPTDFISVLERAGDPGSGIATSEELSERVRKALKVVEATE